MSYYVYENWQADHHKARIHFSDCRYCKNGKGIHPSSSEEHGRWIGPFESQAEAFAAAVNTGGHVSFCKHCNPK